MEVKMVSSKEEISYNILEKNLNEYEPSQMKE